MFVMTMAVSNMDICVIKAVLLVCDYGHFFYTNTIRVIEGQTVQSRGTIRERDINPTRKD